MADPTYSLAWPRELFLWEAGRVLKLPSADLVQRSIGPLLEEAFEDPSVAAEFGDGTWGAWGAGGSPVSASERLTEILTDERKLLPYVEPVYWSERHGLAEGHADNLRVPLATDFIALVTDLQDHGYFPRALPRDCVDEPTSDWQVGKLIRQATKLAIEWPIEDPEALPQGALYSLIEYFNDQAQRPRTYGVHEYAGCGPHYGDYNRETGGAVYRWRANELLRAHGVGLRLGSTPPERGRLIRHYGSPLDDLADLEIVTRAFEPNDEVAHAIRDFRQRGASLPQKRAALALLAGALEPRRKAIGEALSKSDESALFMVANKFMIRHRDTAQRDDFGEEFLDWIFWNYLATVQLMETLEARTQR